MLFNYLICLLFATSVLSIPVAEHANKNLNRVARSPTFHKKGPIGLLLGGLGGNGGGHGGYSGGGGNNYVNINNYGSHGPTHTVDYKPHQIVDHGHGQSGSYAGSAAGGHGGSQSQSQSASFALGPYSVSFAQSQAQGGKGNFFDY